MSYPDPHGSHDYIKWDCVDYVQCGIVLSNEEPTLGSANTVSLVAFETFVNSNPLPAFQI